MNIYEILILSSSTSARNEVLSKEEGDGECRAWGCGTMGKRVPKGLGKDSIASILIHFYIYLFGGMWEPQNV